LIAKNKTDAQQNQQPEVSSWWARVGWLIAIWSMSVLTLGVIAFAIRKFMVAAGMSS